MKLPRDISGSELASRLHQYGYEITRQTGSHLRLSSSVKGPEHHVTIPIHKEVRIGTLNAIVTDVAAYLGVSRTELIETLFGR